MKRIMRWASALLAVACLWVWLGGSAGAAEPPIITEVKAQVTVLSDGALDVKYRLAFQETESRGGITTMGPFDAGHKVLDYHIEHEGQETPITLSSKGGGFYSVDFGFRTTPGADYTVHIHYRVSYAADWGSPLDETSVGEESYRVLEWSPIEWSLEISEQIVTFILPIELPADVTQPEQVTDELVDRAGILVDDAVIGSFDRWVYYPTPDEVSGQNWLSIYVSKTNVPPQYHFRPKVYIPSQYFTSPVAEPTRAQFVASEKPPEPAPASVPSLLPYLLLFGVGGVVLAGLIVFLVLRWVAPKAAPKEYESPEIEVETFERPGLVPDLDAIEAAMYIGDTTKVITLVIMGLVQRGVLTVVNRKPLQLEVSNPSLEMADYEKALVDGIAEDGTLPQATVDRVLKSQSPHHRRAPPCCVACASRLWWALLTRWRA